MTLPDQTRRSSSILPYNRSSTGSFYSTASSDHLPSLTSSSPTTPTRGYPVNFIHLGRQGSGVTTLYAPTQASRRKWVDTIELYRHSVMEKSRKFRMLPITSTFFSSFNKVHCVTTFRSYIIFGCDHGIYIKTGTDIVKLISIEKVSQVDILQDHQIMLILADKTLYMVPMDTLVVDDGELLLDHLLPSPRHSIDSSKSTDSYDTTTALKKISSNVSFFKIGRVMVNNTPRTLVCFVKPNTTSSSIRALEPHKQVMEQQQQQQQKSKRTVKHNPLSIFIRNTTDVLQVYKDLYIPGEATSIQYFKSSIIVGSVKGFQMVDVSSTEVQSKYIHKEKKRGRRRKN